MGRFLISFILFLAGFGHSHAQSDAKLDKAVQDAMNAAFTAVMTAELDAPEASRIYAMTAIAIHDSYEISKGRQGYVSDEIGVAKSDDLIAASVKAVLGQEFSQYMTSPNSPLALEIANDILRHFVKPLPEKFEEKGLWRIGSEIPLTPEWVNAPLLEMDSASQFRADGPPETNSPEFIEALNEVKLLGEDLSQARLADPSIRARFWMDAPTTYTPPGRWNYIAIETFGDMPVETKIDMLLALNVALYEAGIAAWNTKYRYRFWRPDMAIKAHYPNEEWKPMAENPLHPEYVSGHSTFSGAAAKVLTAFAGEKPFCTVSEELWDLERCFPSYQAAAEEAGMSRIYGGIHFRFSNEDGLKLGADVAEHALNRLQEKGVIAKP